MIIVTEEALQRRVHFALDRMIAAGPYTQPWHDGEIVIKAIGALLQESQVPYTLRYDFWERALRPFDVTLEDLRIHF